MLAETYEKFKSQLKAQKTGNEQLPEVVQTSDEQVHYICSYNHYPVKDDDTKSGLIHNDVYNTDELTHEFEYGLFEDIIKSEQLMADLKQIDEYEASIQEQLNNEFDYFPLKEFNNAGVIPNENDPGLKLAADAELFEIEQQVMQQQPDEKRAPKVSHVHHQHDSDSTKDRYYHHVHTVNCPVYVPYNDEKQEVLLPSTTEMSRKENAKALYNDENFNEWNADSYFDDSITDTETFSYGHYDGPK